MGNAADASNHMRPSQANLLIAVSIIALTAAIPQYDPSWIPPAPLWQIR
jgi:hypothetical protein